MLVYSQLIKAQLENLASDPSTPSTGLMYFNTSTLLPKWYTGAAWKIGVDTDSIQTLTAKVMSGSVNTFSNIDLTASTTGSIGFARNSDVDLTTPAVDGQALVYDAVASKWLAGASGDASFKLQSVSTPNLTLKGGFIIDDAGRELATYNGATYGSDLTVSLTTILGSSPANATTYYLYIDRLALSAAVTESGTGRKLYAVTISQLALSTTVPESIDKSRYYPIGLVLSATSGTVWSGAGASFKTLAFRRHQTPSVNVSPLLQTIGPYTVGVVGDVNNLAGGHLKAASSYPSALTTATLSNYALAANPNDSIGTRNFTNNNTTPFTGIDIRGTAAAAAALVAASSHSFSYTTDTFFNAGDTAFTADIWAALTDWTPASVMSLMSKAASSTDEGWGVEVSTSGDIVLRYPVTASTTGTITIPNPGFVDASWHHFAVRYLATTDTWDFFIDGVKQGSATQVNLTTSAALMRLGARYTTPAQFMTGRLNQFGYAKSALSDAEILKLFSVKLAALGNVPVVDQRWNAEMVYGDISSQFDSDFLVDKDISEVWVVFGEPSTASVTVKQFHAGLSASVLPVRSYDVTFTAAPGATIAHGLPGTPTSFAVLHNELADGKYVPLNAENYLKADATNIYTAGFGSLTIDATHQLRIVAAVGQPSIAFARDFSENLTPMFIAKTTTYTAVAGDQILADTSGAAFTITLPASPVAGVTKVTIFDSKKTFDTNNLTVARNGLNIESAAADLTLNVKGTKAELIYIDATVGWRLY